MTSFSTKTKFTVSATKTDNYNNNLKPKQNPKPVPQRRKSVNNQRLSSLSWSQNGRRRKRKMEDISDFKNHSPGTTAMTPPLSPLYSLQNGQSSTCVAWYYSDPQPTGDFVGYNGLEGTSLAVQPSPEAIDDLVSEHFRNCGVNLTSSGPADYNEMFPNDQGHFPYDHTHNGYPIMHQVKYSLVPGLL